MVISKNIIVSHTRTWRFGPVILDAVVLSSGGVCNTSNPKESKTQFHSVEYLASLCMAGPVGKMKEKAP